MDANFPEMPAEPLNERETALAEQLAVAEAEKTELAESIAEVRALLAHEDRGWTLIEGVVTGERLEGLDVEEVQAIGRMLAPRVAAASLTKRAVDLHTGHVFGKGLQIEGTQRPRGTRGSTTGLYRLFSKQRNQESVFGPTARTALQKARFIDGNVLAACNRSTQTIDIIPFSQVRALRVDPDFPDRILAYLREWTPDPKTGESRLRWYLTPRFEGTQRTIAHGGKPVPVMQDARVIDLRVNRQEGHVLGIPDGLAGLHWAEAYGQHMRYGQTVTEALARILYKITNKSKSAAQNSAVKIAGLTGYGNAASLGDGQDVEAIRTAGNAYSFDKLRPIAGLAAAAWNVSLADLLNDSAAAGSSYGALSALAPGNRNAMTTMQDEWGAWLQDIIEYMGHGRPDIHWEPLETPDPYRAAQSLMLLSMAFTDEELRGKALDIQDISGLASQIPPTLEARSTPQTAAQQASPDQGRSNGTGGADDAQRKDLRTDVLANMMTTTNLDRMQDLVERMEAAAGVFGGEH